MLERVKDRGGSESVGSPTSASTLSLILFDSAYFLSHFLEHGFDPVAFLRGDFRPYHLMLLGEVHACLPCDTVLLYR